MYKSYGVDSNTDQLKDMIMNTDFYLLTITWIVSVLHTIFEMLAIKNEISFWKNVKSHQGLSLRSLYYNFYVAVIIFLYLLDNDTSMLIISSTGINIFISLWKVIKTSNFKRKSSFPYFEAQYQDQYMATTDEYDQIAMRYMSYFLMYFPYFLI